MNAIIRLVLFEFALIRMLFFRVIFERATNTLMSAVAGFGAVFLNSYWQGGVSLAAVAQDVSIVQGMILFAFLYAETIMANWQYTTNKTGRMELIFNSTQPPLLIIFVKAFASACVTLASMALLYFPPLAFFGLLGVYNASFWLCALATLLVCCCVMTFNAVFEFRFKQVKALTSLLNLLMPYLATTYAFRLPDWFGFLPYFNGAKFLNYDNAFGVGEVVWLFFTAAVTGGVFLILSQIVVMRIRAKALVYLE